MHIGKKTNIQYLGLQQDHYNDKDVASDVGVNLCNVKSCLNTSNNEIFTDKRGDLPCVNISKHTCPVVKCSDEKFVLVYIYLSFQRFYQYMFPSRITKSRVYPG